MTSKIGSFKGNATISLISPTDDESKGKFPFTFGVNKARLIVENIKDIEKFVEDNTKEE